MRKSMHIIAMLISMATLFAQESKNFSIEVEITDIDSSDGQMLIGLYNTENEWLESPFKGMYGKIVNGRCQAVFYDIPNGTYAISVFHDEDSDRKLDAILGVPSEDTGSSNNAPAKFGPPKWQDARFKLNRESIKQSIKL